MASVRPMLLGSPASGGGVPGVILGRPKVQVVGVAARRAVAMVENQHPLGDRAVFGYPRPPVGKLSLERPGAHLSVPG